MVERPKVLDTSRLKRPKEQKVFREKAGHGQTTTAAETTLLQTAVLRRIGQA